MFEKRILVKAVYYRFYDEKDKTERKYYIQVAKDSHNNPYDLELSYEQFNKFLNDGAIKCIVSTKTTLPTLNKDMPSYCYHNISTDIYEFNDNFDLNCK